MPKSGTINPIDFSVGVSYFPRAVVCGCPRGKRVAINIGRTVVFRYQNIDPFFKFISSEDAIFHYTKKEIALEKILPEKSLKLSSFQNMNDPHEYNDIALAGTYWGDEPLNHDKTIMEVQKKYNDIIKNKSGVISFCQNTFVNNQLVTHGCLKPRMWTQYGDNHRGVCLVFSKEKLLEYAKTLFPIVMGQKINYYNYLRETLLEHKIIDYNRVQSMGIDNYLNESIKSRSKNLFFSKHQDYSDENEFRIALINVENAENCFIPFIDSLQGVIVGDRFPEIYHGLLNELSTQQNIIFKKIAYKLDEYFLFDLPK
jgi:hypothetical protein